jgi:hypothetical protein
VIIQITHQSFAAHEKNVVPMYWQRGMGTSPPKEEIIETTDGGWGL